MTQSYVINSKDNSLSRGLLTIPWLTHYPEANTLSEAEANALSNHLCVMYYVLCYVMYICYVLCYVLCSQNASVIHAGQEGQSQAGLKDCQLEEYFPI